MVEGLRDGTVDLIATDHAPHGHIEKMCTFDEAANGISVLETALGSLMSLVHSGAVSLPRCSTGSPPRPPASWGWTWAR